MVVIGTFLRAVLGFLAACLAGGIVLVGFVITPVDLAQLSGAARIERLASAGVLALAVATHAAIFAAPFALIGITIGEWYRYREWTYSALIGIAIGLAGFFAQYAGEASGTATILNVYAFTAHIAAGLVAGVIYWWLAGRFGPRLVAGLPADGESVLDGRSKVGA